jgi:hypothetical protein
MEDLGCVFEITLLPNYSRSASADVDATLSAPDEDEYRFPKTPHHIPIQINIAAKSLLEATRKAETSYPASVISSARCVLEELRG